MTRGDGMAREGRIAGTFDTRGSDAARRDAADARAAAQSLKVAGLHRADRDRAGARSAAVAVAIMESEGRTEALRTSVADAEAALASSRTRAAAARTGFLEGRRVLDALGASARDAATRVARAEADAVGARVAADLLLDALRAVAPNHPSLPGTSPRP